MKKVVNKIVVEPLCTHQDLRCYEGEFLGEDEFLGNEQILNFDCDIYALEPGKKKRTLIAKFRKNVIPKKLSQLAIENLKAEAQKASSIRGIASGKIDPKKLQLKNIKGVVNPEAFKSKIIYRDGTISTYYVSNPVNSLIIGYFDKPKLREKSKVLKSKADPCRPTNFLEKQPAKWKKLLPLIRKVNSLYQETYPSKYRYQRDKCSKVRKYCIDRTIFTTITVNYNWQTACHVDKGDLKQGFSCLTISEEGKWSGGYLGLPRYGILFNVREGDLLIFNPHEYHCNTPIRPITKNYTRLSMVYYFREGMLQCSKSKQSKKKESLN